MTDNQFDALRDALAKAEQDYAVTRTRAGVFHYRGIGSTGAIRKELTDARVVVEQLRDFYEQEKQRRQFEQEADGRAKAQAIIDVIMKGE